MEAKNTFRIVGEVVWIDLTLGKVTCVDLADWAKVAGHRWFTDSEYASTWIVGKTRRIKVGMHGLLLGRKWVDHEDRDGMNNRRYNLRPCTAAENQANRRKQVNNTSGFKGVIWEKARGKWRAQVQQAGKIVFIERFLSKLDAARAYNEAAVKVFGKFASLNRI